MMVANPTDGIEALVVSARHKRAAFHFKGKKDRVAVRIADADGSRAVSDQAQVSTPDGNPVKLRAKPSRKCSLYWKVPDGMTVQVKGLVEAQGITWVRVRYGSRKGYIMSEFVSGG